MKRTLLCRTRRDEMEINGFRMHLDPLDSLEISLFGTYEPFQTSLVKAEVQPGMTVVDVGANIGYYTLLFGRMSTPGGKVFAFEPVPQNLEILRRNLAANGIDNVEIVSKAASNQPGVAPFFLSQKNLGDHSFFAADQGRKILEVEMVRIDDVVEGPVDVVKIDIQGAEQRALEGMRRTLERSPAVTLFTEFCPKSLSDAGGSASAFLALLRQYRFELFHIDEYASRLEKADETKLLAELTPKNGRHTNLLCRKGRS